MIALWSIPFWLILICWCILTIFFVDDGDDGHESNGWGATITIGIMLLVFYFLGDANIKTFFRSFSFLGILKFVGLYLIVGVIWSFIKWYLLLLRQKEKWQEDTKSYFRIPLAKDYKSEIIVWMSYWPWSMTWTLINDPIKRLFNFIYLKFSTLYQKLANKVFKDALKMQQEIAAAKLKAEEELKNEVERRKQERKNH